MTYLGLLRCFLDIEVKLMDDYIFISQTKYDSNILKRFNMRNCKPAPTLIVMGLKLSKEDCSNNVNLTLYKIMVGSLMYLTASRLDLMYASSLVSRFMETPKETNWQEIKITFRYVNETKGYGILFTTPNDFRLVGYIAND